MHSSSRHATRRRTERARASQLGGTHALPCLLRLWPAGVRGGHLGPRLRAGRPAELGGSHVRACLLGHRAARLRKSARLERRRYFGPRLLALRAPGPPRLSLCAAGHIGRICRSLRRAAARAWQLRLEAIFGLLRLWSSSHPDCSGPHSSQPAAGKARPTVIRTVTPASNRQRRLHVWDVSATRLYTYPLQPTASIGVGCREPLPNMHPRRSRCVAAARSAKRVGLCCVQICGVRC